MKLEQKRLWCQHIKTLILDNYEAVIPDKAKELVMMLGRSRYEGDICHTLKLLLLLLETYLLQQSSTEILYFLYAAILC